MNIQMQLGGICILLLLLYFYKRQGTLGLYISKIFLRSLYITFCCLVLDILSIVLIVNQDVVPLWLVKTECKAYLVSLVATGYVALIYANADIRHLAKADRFTVRLTIVVGAVAVLIFVSPISIFYEGGSVAYTYGPACSATYAGALILILATLIKLYVQGQQMNPKRRNAIALWLIIWIIAALTQFLNSELLLVGFAGAIGIMILFFELENPEIYIDRSTGFYNSYALVEFIRQRYLLDKNCYGVLVSLENIQKKSISLTKMEAALAEVVQFIRQLPDTMVFKTDDREFSLSFENTEAYEKVRDIVCSRFRQGWLENSPDSPDGEPLFLQPHYLFIPSGNVAENAEEMLGLLKHFRLHCAESSESYVLTLDEDTIAKKRQRDEMLKTIILAINEDRVEVFYQPIYSTAKKKFVSAEALVRIRRADGSIIPPGLFIPIAEETGLIGKIGNIVFEKTCRFIKESDIVKYGIEYIEVNLSVVQCENKALAEEYINIMKKYDLPSRYINLEITESAAIAKKNILLDNMRRLIDYGVEFSLDDFGNGQSNLNYIMDMPVQIVKFDHDMTQAYFETEKAQFVLQATANMIHDMRLKTVAEGVETADQLAVLEGLGIDYIQGYYFSKPLEGKEFIKFIRERN